MLGEVLPLKKLKLIRMETTKVKAFGTAAAEASLKQMNIERRGVTANDIEMEILYCGVCHSDLHTARNDWGGTIYPAVPRVIMPVSKSICNSR